MIDFSPDLWWFAFVSFGSYAAVPITIVTAAIGAWYVKTRSRKARYALVLASIAFCLSAYGAATYALPIAIQSRIDEERDAADTHRLTAPTRFRGNTLPAGSTLHFEENDSAYRVELHGPATIAGIPVTGSVDVSAAGIDGAVTLARDTTIAGIACKAPYRASKTACS